MSHSKGNERTVVEPVFDDIDLEKSPPIDEPPPPYNESASPQLNSIYPSISIVTSPKQWNNGNQQVPAFTTSPILAPTIVRGKCCREELLAYSKTLFCKHCNTNVQSTLSYENGKRYYRRLFLLIIISIICPIFIICLLMLLLSNRHRDITHRCPYCHTTLGIHVA
uniref:LITAF domain-containing protein n=1 Tax=Strongyloides venezuelensis TaxID=75913 RepID=A0A0K0FCG3_STRVS